ncbi:hypothetical protein QR680_017121 [Steinernema hermaphroditum]|uniref:Secreted protein n=1 Tax=Steinernema hermaphroditum TaxID=289476 RepID=A0AA39LN34_9BILA|nr:hypothetical protein QR680_017121 [Steinernema hermaphroditum]
MVILLFLLGVLSVAVADAAQCQLGLKLFSVEAGKALCAPFVPFGCVEACEWNSTCERTSHWRSFGSGRRSFVTGMLLSNQTFYVQCCASMSTIVGSNDDCRWSHWEDVVTAYGSLRAEPVLRANEYIREVAVERPNTQFWASVKIRLEVCRFRVQRAHCNKELMPEEDRRIYDLQLLRLSRASILSRDLTTTVPPLVPTPAGRFEARAGVVLDSDINRVDSFNSDLTRLQRQNPIVKVDTDNNTSALVSVEDRCRRRSKRTLDREECHREFKSCCDAKSYGMLSSTTNSTYSPV